MLLGLLDAETWWHRYNYRQANGRRLLASFVQKKDFFPRVTAFSKEET